MTLTAHEIIKLIKEEDKYSGFAVLFKEPFVEQFIRWEKYSISKTLDSLQNYIYLRSGPYANFTNRIDSSRTDFFRMGVVRPLKRNDQHGRLVGVINAASWDPSIIPMDQVIVQTLLQTDEILFNYPQASNQGVVFLIDLAGLSLSQVLHVTPTALYRVNNLIARNTPIKYKALHIVHPGYVVSTLVTAAKMVLSPKLSKRLQIHKDLASLYRYVTPGILPVSLGGPWSEKEAYDFEFEKRIRSPDRAEYYENFKRVIKETREKALYTSGSWKDTIFRFF